MPYCRECGAPLSAGASFCENCGTRIVPIDAPQQTTQASRFDNTDSVPRQEYSDYTFDSYDRDSNNTPADSGSFGWGVLGFFLPLVGFILYFAWKRTKPRCAKVAGIGALIGFLCNVVLTYTQLL